ncbi:MAG: MFS transporter [Acidobacteria bacterium]|nr:MFS transporter [Acidobacteriota bacterium]
MTKIGENTTVQRSEVAAIYTAAIVQGLALVTFPAASTVFTSPQHYGLSSTKYGSMFVPQAITAIVASLLGGGLNRRLGIKRIYLLGLTANLVSMVLLILSQFVMSNGPVAYSILLLATTSLGIGFGLTVPALNTFTAAFFPQKIDSAVLILNALLGLGTVLAPVLVAVFIGLGIWWALPVLAVVLLLALLLFSLRLPLKAGALDDSPQGQKGETALPSRFWIFAAFALFYGIVETMNGNWATLYMSRSLGATVAVASFALMAFWGMVTAGRLSFAAIAKRFPSNRTYRLLPFVIALAFAVIAYLPAGSSFLGILAFGLTGLGCSALLPLTISFGQEEMSTIAASIPGGLIAFYQMGYGIAAFGVGPLEEYAGLSLKALFGIAAVVALILASLSFVVTRHGAPVPNGWQLHREKEKTL